MWRIVHVPLNLRDLQKSDLLIDERRVNVALTRAKQKLILLGCRHSVVRHKVIADLLNILRPDQLCTLELV